MCRAPGADDADGVVVALFQRPPTVDYDWWRVNFPQRLGIGGGFLRYDRGAKIANTLELRTKINSRFPVADLIGDFIADSLNLATLTAFRCEDLLRFFESLQQFP